MGIAGTVAETKDVINIKNAYDDPRFNGEIDQKTGYKTNAMLSMPICNYEGDVIGVAQIINKTNGRCLLRNNKVENNYFCYVYTCTVCTDVQIIIGIMMMMMLPRANAVRFCVRVRINNYYTVSLKWA